MFSEHLMPPRGVEPWLELLNMQISWLHIQCAANLHKFFSDAKLVMMIDRSSFNFTRTLNLSSISFVLNENRQLPPKYGKILIVTLGTRQRKKRLRHLEVTHTTFTKQVSNVWFPVFDVDLERYPRQNQGGSNKSIFSIYDQLFLSRMPAQSLALNISKTIGKENWE